MYACDWAMCLSKVSSGLPAIRPPTLPECWPNVCDVWPAFRQGCAVFLVWRQCCNQQTSASLTRSSVIWKRCSDTGVTLAQRLKRC